jgi:hypothetical protein
MLPPRKLAQPPRPSASSDFDEARRHDDDGGLLFH